MVRDAFLRSILFWLFVCAESYAISAPLPKKINIYCTSNLDGTGECYEVKTNTVLKCTAAPGEVIPCRTKSGERYGCILFSWPLFACDLVVSKDIETQANKLNSSTAFKDSLESGLEDDLNQDEFQNVRTPSVQSQGSSKESNRKDVQVPTNVVPPEKKLMPAW